MKAVRLTRAGGQKESSSSRQRIVRQATTHTHGFKSQAKRCAALRLPHEHRKDSRAGGESHNNEDSTWLPSKPCERL
jgi:hypothetical protein